MKTTGLTPTQHAREEAALWIRTVQLQNAHHDGVRSVRDQQDAQKAIDEMLKG